MKKEILKITEISMDTKKKVLERQNNRSIFGTYLTLETANFHHVINTGLGIKGVGFEWNVVALSFDEHRSYHDKTPIKVNGVDRYTYEEAKTIIKNYLKIIYPNWSEDKCKYHKGWEGKDYGITRKKI